MTINYFVCLIFVLTGQVLCQQKPSYPILDALYLHNASITNLSISSLRDCSFRPSNEADLCPDDDIHIYLHTSLNDRQIVRHNQFDWLRQSKWDPQKEDVVLIHGYAGGDGSMPMVVLRDAYLKTGRYNVWIVDWGVLGQPPCYRAAVHNTKAVARCTGAALTFLRTSGLDTDKLTCVGHSLGAHICGMISRFVHFRVHRIVALDPAKPLVANSLRLGNGDAMAVHVIHTNAGHYGETGKVGDVDFCVNGGKIQPFCENAGFDEHLCSHVWSVCYMAQSLDPQMAQKAEPCSRRCPTGPLSGHRIGIPVLMGQFTPITASGSYCLRDTHPPYCPQHSGGPGDVRCCLMTPKIKRPKTAEE